MAGRTIFRSRLVKQHCLRVDDARQLVTLSAPHALVCPAQGERRPGLVVKQRWLPLGAVVALGASCHVSLGKLLSVNILVAVLALHGRSLEIDVEHLGFKVGRLVTIDAGGRAMGTKERELGLRVIESGKLFPRLGRMTGLAPGGGTVGANLKHALLELALVRIGVATGAVQIFPVIDHGLGLKLRRFFVAIGARNRDVPSGQHEVSFLVLGQAESRRFVAFQVVTPVAGVEVWRGRELGGMLVGMAVGATVELHLEQRVLALGNVTLRAFQARVATLQWIRRRGMFLYGKD